MYETKTYKKASMIFRFIDFRNAAVLFLLVMLLKLLYFSRQIGDSGFVGLHGFYALGPLLLLATFGMLFRNKAAKWYFITIDALLTILIFSNVVFYRYFNDMLSIPLLFQAGNLSDIQSSTLKLIHWSDILLCIDFLFLLTVRLTLPKQPAGNRAQRTTLWKPVVCFAAGILIVYAGFSSLIKNQPTILQTFYDRVYVAQNIGLLDYQAADAYRFVQQAIADSSKLEPQKLQEINKFFAEKNANEMQGQVLHGAGKGKNLIVIQVEALQQFVIGKSINGQEITPNLNKLAASNIYFDNYYFQTAGGGTSDAEFAANMSMFPMKEGAVYIRKAGNSYYSLPMKLKTEGYSTIAMHGYKPGFWNRSMVYKNIGFDEFFNINNMDQTDWMGMGVSDKSFFDQAVQKLKTQQRPYHSFLITLSSHFPYENDKSKYSSFAVGQYKDTLLGNYFEALHYTDEALGQFISKLKQEGMLDNAVLVVYGDHHGVPKDNKAELENFLGKGELNTMQWTELQKVPMIIRVPGQTQPMRIETVGGSVDFMPTVLNILGIEHKDMPIFGQDLLNAKQGMAVLRNGSFVTDEILYISSENKCYETATGQELPLERYTAQKQEADKLLDYSDTIIKYNLVDEIKEYLIKHRA